MNGKISVQMPVFAKQMIAKHFAKAHKREAASDVIATRSGR